ncbi:MAG: sodium-dependent bicarbonate transport family permease [Leptospiraceae bacterium]|nr:MAG: sodium-dependent bicarbonate transport family permease [Leptospiraceae bacterium]
METINLNLLTQNFLNPIILFFFLGILAVLLKSDLEIPQPLPKFFSLYLLISIGLQGGHKLNKGDIDSYVLIVIGSAILFAIIVPIYTFYILRKKLDLYNSVALASTYGSISAVTFITAGAFITTVGEKFGGYMVAAMALMESPAIIIGLILFSIYNKDNNDSKLHWKEIFIEAFLNASVFLLLGSLIIGYITGEKGWKTMEPLFGDLFKPMLAFFLLDLGIVTAKKLNALKKVGVFLVSFGIIIPIINAILSILFAKLLNFQSGDAFMFSILCASASYIAVPAALRMSLPEANPSIYVTLSLAVTFPFNIIVGIPLYYYFIKLLWG